MGARMVRWGNASTVVNPLVALQDTNHFVLGSQGIAKPQPWAGFWPDGPRGETGPAQHVPSKIWLRPVSKLRAPSAPQVSSDAAFGPPNKVASKVVRGCTRALRERPRRAVGPAPRLLRPKCRCALLTG